MLKDWFSLGFQFIYLIKNYPYYSFDFHYSGFIVFGSYDPVTGESTPETSFEGRLSRLIVLDARLNQTGVTNLYNR